MLSAVGSQCLLQYLACDGCSNVLVEIVPFFSGSTKYISVSVKQNERVKKMFIFFNHKQWNSISVLKSQQRQSGNP